MDPSYLNKNYVIALTDNKGSGRCNNPAGDWSGGKTAYSHWLQSNEVFDFSKIIYPLSITVPSNLVQQVVVKLTKEFICLGGHAEIAHGHQILNQAAYDPVILKWEGS